MADRNSSPLKSPEKERAYDTYEGVVSLLQKLPMSTGLDIDISDVLLRTKEEIEALIDAAEDRCPLYPFS